MFSSRTIVSITAFFCLLASCHGQSQSESRTCDEFTAAKAPRFKIVKRWRTDLAPGLVLMLRISPSDASKENLLALSCEIGRTHSTEQSLFVWIFDSTKAAKRYNTTGEGNHSRITASLLGIYGYVRSEPKLHAFTWYRNSTNHYDKVEFQLGPIPDKGQI